MADEMVGVYLPDSNGEPVAVFRDADQAQRWRRAEHGDAGIVGPVKGSIQRNQAMADALAPPESEEAVPPTGDQLRRAEIRAKLEADERDTAMTEEVRREMAEDRKADERKAKEGSR